MRRTALKRRTPLARGGRIKAKPPRRLKRADSDPAYLALVRAMPCYMALLGSCEGRIHAHHMGRKPGMGMKAPDSTAIPFCELHHREWHDCAGVFRLSRELRRVLGERAIAETRLLLGRVS